MYVYKQIEEESGIKHFEEAQPVASWSTPAGILMVDTAPLTKCNVTGTSGLVGGWDTKQR